jgi:chromosome segregation ATPase
MLLPVAVVLCALLAGSASSDTPGQEAAKGKADGDTDLEAVKKELAELAAQIAAKEKELAELRKKTVPLRARITEAKLALKVDAAIQEARGQYPRNRERALQLLGEIVLEVWETPEIGEDARDALLNRLVTARRDLVKERK